MATTTNFGWETPDDTDYVKDGAAAMRTLGNSIDSSMADLKGGTTGQVLSKNTNADMDFVWVTQDDANAIQNAIVDAKGDLITATAADTPSRLGVGTNGQVLTANSATATGLEWTTLGATAFSGASLTRNTIQTVSTATQTLVLWNDEQFDTDSYHSTSTNTSRITIPTAKNGKYRLSWYFQLSHASTAPTNNGWFRTTVLKNGSTWNEFNMQPVATYLGMGIVGSIIVDTVATDYWELSLYHNTGITLDISQSATNKPMFQIEFLGA